MPKIEAELSDFKDRKHFASMDFCAGYWQVPLGPEYHDACEIIAPEVTLVSTPVLHGLKNASAYFESTIPPLFDKLTSAIKTWIDDSRIHCKTEKELLEHVEGFFEICNKHKIRLLAKKCSFHTKKVKWFGRVIDRNG